MKKAAAPLSPRVATAGSCSSFSGSGVSPEIASVVTSQPMGGDDCAINDLLEGRTDLCLVLPDNRQVLVNVERRTPVMDLLVQVATANKINPSGHVIQVTNDKGYDAVCKPNTPVGSLDVKELFIVPKASSTNSDLPHKRTARKAVQPFEPTFRLQVRLPRNQLAVLRVTLGTTLGQVKQTVCEEKGLDPQGYQLVALGRPPVAPLDPALTLEQFGAAEVGLMSNRALAASIQNSATDLISYSITKESKKGIIGLLTHHRSKGSLTGSSSDGVSSRGTSPARSDPLAPMTNAPAPLELAPNAPCRAPAKKRPAPQPPIQSQTVMSSKESKGNSDVAMASVSGEQGITRTHSRQSSDSSGYHEASVLSDLPETPSPETVCGSSGMGSVDSPPHSLEVSRPRRDKGPRKPRPDSLASDASSGHGKKRRAPPPPPLAEASASPGADSTERNAHGGQTTPIRTLPLHNHVDPLRQEKDAGCSGEHAASVPVEVKVSVDEGLYENSRVLKEGGAWCQEPVNSHSCPPSAGAGTSAVIFGRDADRYQTSTPAEVMTQEEIMLHIDASFGAIEGNSTESTIMTTSWEYGLPEPPSPFRSTAPLGLNVEGITLAEEVTEVIADAVSDSLREEFEDDSSLVDSGHVENFRDDVDGHSEQVELLKKDKVGSSASICSISEEVIYASMGQSDPTNNENIRQSEASYTTDHHQASLCGENIVKLESTDISGRTVSDSPLAVEETAVEIVAAQEQTKDHALGCSPLSSEAVSTLNEVQNVQSETVMIVASEELCKEQSFVNEGEVAGATAHAWADTAVVPVPTDDSLLRGADTCSDRSPYERSDSLMRSRSMNCGPISFSIGSYGSYKTETVDDIFSDEPGRVRYDRFKNIRVACSPCVQNIVKKKSEVGIKEGSLEISMPVVKVPVATEGEHSSKCRPSVGSGFTCTIAKKPNGDTGVENNSSSSEKPLVARSSSMLDLREPAAEEPRHPKLPETSETCLADEKETLLNEYAKLQLQFVAWQQQLATNQNLLENKNIVPSVATTASQPNPKMERENCDVPKRIAETSTLPRSRPHRPVSLLAEHGRASLSGVPAPRVQLGSWTERRDNLAAAVVSADKPTGTPECTSTKPCLLRKPNEVLGHSVAQPRDKADAQIMQSIPKPQLKPKTNLPPSKPDSRPVPKKPTGILYSAPTVRGFSQEAVSKLVEEMMLAKKEGHGINGRTTRPISSPPELDVWPKVATRDISSQKETSRVDDLPRKPRAAVSTVPRGMSVAKDATVEKSKICTHTVTPLKEDKEKEVHHCLSGLQSEIVQSARIPNAVSDANKPSVVRATLKSGVTTTAVVPPPPPPPTLPLNGELRKKVPNGRSRSVMDKDSKPGLLPVDPREVLMNEIRTFGGKSSLKKVSTEPAWQLNICNLRSAPV